jgi:hypothetical protein
MATCQYRPFTHLFASNWAPSAFIFLFNLLAGTTIIQEVPGYVTNLQALLLDMQVQVRLERQRYFEPLTILLQENYE